MSFKSNWEYFALHVWLFSSSFGIIYAILSFCQDLGLIKLEYYWIKGTTALFVGLLFYFIIGLPHLNGGKKYCE